MTPRLASRLCSAPARGGVLIVFVLAIVVSACKPTGIVEQSSTSAIQTPSSSQRADLCHAYDRVSDEWMAIRDAFRSVIANDMDGAIEQARSTRANLDELIDGLPPPGWMDEDEKALSERVKGWANIVDGVAAIIDRPGFVDREIVLALGGSILSFTDEFAHLGDPGDELSTTCPDLAFSVEPVAFPPPPSNAALGLPDTVGDLTLEPNVESASSLNAGMLESVGVDPATVRQITVTVTDPDGGIDLVEVLDRVEAAPDALAEAAHTAWLPDATEDGTEDVAGFQVFKYRTPIDSFGYLHAAIRGDRLVIFHDMSDEVVRSILTGMR